MLEVRLAPLIASLALATESAAGVAPETASRAAIVAVAIGDRIGLSLDERRAVYYASLLRFIGCSGFAHETAWFGGGDDIAFLRALTPADTAKVSSVVSHVARAFVPGAGPGSRVRNVARVLRDPQLGRKLARAHCDQATHLAGTLGAGDGVSAILLQTYERFDGKGGPAGLKGERLSPLARVMHVAYCAVLQASFVGPAAAVDVLRARRGGELDPSLVDVFLASAGDLFELVSAISVWDTLLEHEPAPRRTNADVDAVCQAFAHFVDLKSPYTIAHSAGVARLVEAALRQTGAEVDELTLVRRAGWLHDLGRASVPNGIWDKPSALNAIERERARDHAAQSQRILERAGLGVELTNLVGAHHERLDGSGYPRSAPASALGRSARCLAAADVYTALLEERAHRPAHSVDSAARIMSEEVAAKRLDRDAVTLILGAAGVAAPRLRANAPAGLSEREVEVLTLLARGLTNKEIGKRLFISARTVGHHIAHVFDKTGLRTRAAAALFAVQHDLTGPRQK